MGKAIALILGLLTVLLLWFITRAESQAVTVEPAGGAVGQVQVSSTAVATNESSHSTPAALQEVTEQTVDPPSVWLMSDLRPTDLSQAAGFGTAVALWQDTLVVGAPQTDNSVGAVYVFNWDGREWHETARLVASDGRAGSVFGRSLAFDGERLVVGAIGHSGSSSNTGAVYVFGRQGDTWQEEALLLPDNLNAIHFGRSVALDGDTIAVGTPYTYHVGESANSGSVHLFEYDGRNWVHAARLRTNRVGSARSDLFGWTVALQEDTLFIGAYLADQVHVYRRAGREWLSETVWEGPRGSRFGYAVAVDWPVVMVGAPHDSTSGHQFGSASFFEWGGGAWEERARIAPGAAHPGLRFGTAVNLSANVALVGMPGARGEADKDEAGAVSLWQALNGVWVETAVFYAQEPSAGDQLGTAVAIGENIIVAGAPGEQNTSGFTAVFMP